MKMSEINTGGAAFPRPASEHGHGGHYEQDGMTLRDYFAAKAMQAIIEADGIQYTSATEAHAKWAYDQADAMIKARGEQ